MAELVDALALGASGRKAVQVQVLLHAQKPWDSPQGRGSNPRYPETNNGVVGSLAEW